MSILHMHAILYCRSGNFFACANINPLNFRVVFFLSLEHTDEN